MTREKGEARTRQIYASIREDLYLAAKARAAELRIPLRELIETALEQSLEGMPAGATPREARPSDSIWEDEYLRMQVSQPLGSPVEMTREEAERVVRSAFDLDTDGA